MTEPNTFTHARATNAATEADRADWEQPRPAEERWYSKLPGIDLLRGFVPMKKVYFLFCLSTGRENARQFWTLTFRIERDRTTHRMFCGQALAAAALTNGWTEKEAYYLLRIWNDGHGLGLADAQIKDALTKAMKWTEKVRSAHEAKRKREAQRMADEKTANRILVFLTVETPFGPAAVARGIDLPLERVKKACQRLAKAGQLERVDGGYRVPMGVDGDKRGLKTDGDKRGLKSKKNKVNNVFNPLLSPSEDKPNEPSHGEEDPSGARGQEGVKNEIDPETLALFDFEEE